jgi:glycerol dehydrogenase-like iron-containing ADH family enzyme
MIGGKTVNLDIVKATPAQYMISQGITKNIGAYVEKLGKRALVSGGIRALASVADNFHYSLAEHKITWKVNHFSGESSESNILRVMKEANEFEADMIIGVGGGKSLDTAKMAAAELHVPIITVPTIAATCAAVTPLSILYNDEGIYQRNYYQANNPDLVLVDAGVILKTPVKYMYAGILDALAKWYEGGASIVGAKNADIFDYIALQLAKTLHDQMFQKAEKAIGSIKEGKMTDSLIDVINLNIFLAGLIQGLGIKAVGNGIAHSINDGLTVLKESHQLLHGLKVGYGIAAQMVILQKSRNEIDEVLDFFKCIDFRPTFAALNLSFNDSAILAVARKTIEDPLMAQEPYKHITTDMVADAIKRLETFV